jgi:hypothetical protein
LPSQKIGTPQRSLYRLYEAFCANAQGALGEETYKLYSVYTKLLGLPQPCLLGQSSLGVLQISVAYLRVHLRVYLLQIQVYLQQIQVYLQQIRVHLRQIPVHLGVLQIVVALKYLLSFWTFVPAFVAMQSENCSLFIPDS